MDASLAMRRDAFLEVFLMPWGQAIVGPVHGERYGSSVCTAGAAAGVLPACLHQYQASLPSSISACKEEEPEAWLHTASIPLVPEAAQQLAGDLIVGVCREV
jgi:hypothetical protein